MANRKLPNNPKAAYMLGKLHGVQETMGSVAMTLCDKFGWHIAEETEDERDDKSIRRLYDCIVSLTEEINAGRIRHKDIKEILLYEYNATFEGESGF